MSVTNARAHPDADSAEILSPERSTSSGPRDKASSSSSAERAAALDAAPREEKVEEHDDDQARRGTSEISPRLQSSAPTDRGVSASAPDLQQLQEAADFVRNEGFSGWAMDIEAAIHRLGVTLRAAALAEAPSESEPLMKSSVSVALDSFRNVLLKNQIDLPEQAMKVLRDNLWDLYDEAAAGAAARPALRNQKTGADWGEDRLNECVDSRENLKTARAYATEIEQELCCDVLKKHLPNDDLTHAAILIVKLKAALQDAAAAGAAARPEKLRDALAGLADAFERRLGDFEEEPQVLWRAKQALRLAADGGATRAEQVEVLAAYAHEAWTGWMRYLLSCCEQVQIGVWEGALVLPPEWHARWTRQMNTPYADLSEKDKESDREEARKILAQLAADGGAVADGTK